MDFSALYAQCWRVPADTDPATARINDNLVIDVECDNGGPTTSCQPEKTYPRPIPGKMIDPDVLTGGNIGTSSSVSGSGILVAGPLNSLHRRQAGTTGIVAESYGWFPEGFDTVVPSSLLPAILFQGRTHSVLSEHRRVHLLRMQPA
jgi:hypothetical protein